MTDLCVGQHALVGRIDIEDSDLAARPGLKAEGIARLELLGEFGTTSQANLSPTSDGGDFVLTIDTNRKSRNAMLRIKRLERRKFITSKIGFLKSLHYSSNRCPPTRYSILFALSLCFILMKLFHELVVHVRIEFR